MKINIITDATYYPSKISRQQESTNVAKNSENKTKETSKFEKMFLEKISSEEVTALQKQFGNFKAGNVGENQSGKISIEGRLNNIPRGSFIDIKI